MTLVFAGLLLVAIWLARRLVRRDRAIYVSEQWRIEHLYTDGRR